MEFLIKKKSLLTFNEWMKLVAPLFVVCGDECDGWGDSICFIIILKKGESRVDEHFYLKYKIFLLF